MNKKISRFSSLVDSHFAATKTDLEANFEACEMSYQAYRKEGQPYRDRGEAFLVTGTDLVLYGAMKAAEKALREHLTSFYWKRIWYLALGVVNKTFSRLYSHWNNFDIHLKAVIIIVGFQLLIPICVIFLR